MPSSPPTRVELQRAVDAANEGIRGFWASVGDRLPDVVEWAEHDRLTADWNRATAALRAREAEDEPAAGLVLTA